MLPEIPPEQFSALLERVAGELLDAAGVAGPPVDAAAVARRLGMVVAADGRMAGRARHVRLGARGYAAGRAAILLAPEPRRERRQWAVAHELGEHAAERVFAALGVDPREAGDAARERVANELAARMLLPGGWFARAARDCGWDLAGLKERFATASHELIARRMLDFPPPVIVTIFDNGRLHWRRSNVPGRVPPLSAAEHNCRTDAHQTGQAAEAPNRDPHGSSMAYP